MSEIFDIDRSVITKHLKSIFNEGELDKNQVCAKFAHTANDGKKYNTEFYNLDAIISVGYRVNSKKYCKELFKRRRTKETKQFNYIIFRLCRNNGRRKSSYDDERLDKWNKANTEYEKYRIKQDEQYISSMDKMYKRYLNENK